jgi:hypothetical protein
MVLKSFATSISQLRPSSLVSGFFASEISGLLLG